MVQTLFPIPREIGGLPVFGVGLLLGVWCVFGVVVLITVWRRAGFGSELVGYVPLLAIVAAAIVWLLPRLCDAQGVPIRGFGVMLLAAVVTSTALLVHRAKRVGLDSDTMVSLVFWMFVPGIVGARLFFVIEYWPDYHRETVAETVGAILSYAAGGLVVYGSFLGGMLGIWLFVRKQRLPMLAILDLLAPSFMLGLAIGRVGCLANGCCFGGPCDARWAITFPDTSPVYAQQLARGEFWGFSLGADPKGPPVVASVEPDGQAAKAGLAAGRRLLRVNGQAVRTAGEAGDAFLFAAGEGKPIRLETSAGTVVVLRSATLPARSRPVHPTQIYSSVGALLICLVLLAFAPFRRHDGEVFALLLTIYPVIRFLEEAIRTDEGAVFGTGMSIAQNVSVLMLLAVAGLWVFLLRRPRGTALPVVTYPE